jgi:hypothetical protein
LRKEKGCTGEGSGFQELEEKRAEAKIAQSIVQIPLMESYDLHDYSSFCPLVVFSPIVFLRAAKMGIQLDTHLHFLPVRSTFT